MFYHLKGGLRLEGGLRWVGLLFVSCALAFGAGSQVVFAAGGQPDLDKALVGRSPLPNAQPSPLARRVSAYMSGHWRVVGTSVSGKRLFAGQVMARPGWR